MSKSLFALATLAPLMLFASPVSAAPDGAMADHKMAADDHMAMKPMSAADKKMMAKCHKMPAAKAAKNAKCVAMMKMHEDKQMDHAM